MNKRNKILLIILIILIIIAVIFFIYGFKDKPLGRADTENITNIKSDSNIIANDDNFTELENEPDNYNVIPEIIKDNKSNNEEINISNYEFHYGDGSTPGKEYIINIDNEYNAKILKRNLSGDSYREPTEESYEIKMNTIFKKYVDLIKEKKEVNNHIYGGGLFVIDKETNITYKLTDADYNIEKLFMNK